MATTIALIAHDNKKNDLVNFVKQHSAIFSRYHLIATGTTGQKIEQGTGLGIEKMASGPLGGDAQIAAKVVNDEIAAVIFLIDPLYAQPHEPDIKALLRLCEVYNVPLATNLATAKAIIELLGKTRVGHLIFNPVAGQGNPDQELDLIRKFLQPEIHLNVIFTRTDVSVTEQSKEIVAKIRSAENAEENFIIASGGDGTVSEIAAALIGTKIPLGIIPRGTANAFSVALGIPTQLQGACDTIRRGVTRIVDTAMCNNTPMLLLAGIGFEAETVAKTDRDLKNRLGVMAYIWAGIQQAQEQQLFEAEIELDGQVTTTEANAITIANAAPPTSVLAQGTGDVLFDDGLLDITIASSQTTLQGIQAIASLFASALVKNPTNREDIIYLRAKKIKVKTNPDQKVVVDGEIVGTTPIEIKCIPNSLTVFVPLINNL
jgi:methylglyoxal synthase